MKVTEGTICGLKRDTAAEYNIAPDTLHTHFVLCHILLVFKFKFPALATNAENDPTITVSYKTLMKKVDT